VNTFVKTPTFVMHLMAEGRISRSAFCLYVVLRSYQNNDNRHAWPSFQKLADTMNVPHRQNIGQYIAELVDAGAVVKISRGRGLSSIYRFPESAQSDSPETATSDSPETDTSFPEWVSDSPETDTLTVQRLTGDSPETATSDSPETALTRSTELDRGTRPTEQEKPVVDVAKPSPRRGAGSVSADASTQVRQPPLMQAVPDLPPTLDDRGRETLGTGVGKFHEAIEYLNNHRPVGHELNPAEERDLRDALRARTAPAVVFDHFTATGARSTA
jgi:hypothetical protein